MDEAVIDRAILDRMEELYGAKIRAAFAALEPANERWRMLDPQLQQAALCDPIVHAWVSEFVAGRLDLKAALAGAVLALAVSDTDQAEQLRLAANGLRGIRDATAPEKLLALFQAAGEGACCQLLREMHHVAAIVLERMDSSAGESESVTVVRPADPVERGPK